MIKPCPRDKCEFRSDGLGWFYCIHCLRHISVSKKHDNNNDDWFLVKEEANFR